MNRIHLRIKLILLAASLLVIVLLAGILALQIFRAATFRVVSTDPATKAVSTTAPFFRFTFNQPIQSKGLQVHSSPTGFTGAYSVKGKVLTIPFTALLASGNIYTITLVNVSSATSGKKITNKTFTFKPHFITSADLSAEQRQALLNKEDVGSTNPSDPIIKSLPHQTVDFLLDQDSVPRQDETKFPLQADLYLTISDVTNGTTRDTAIAQYKQEVVDYITSLGLDPNNYAITYIVQNP